MDHELKQRLIGAVVVTALCAIFIPMLFDDPIDNSGQVVSELGIPEPVSSGEDIAGKLPASTDEVLTQSDTKSLPAETAGDTLESTGAVEEDEQPVDESSDTDVVEEVKKPVKAAKPEVAQSKVSPKQVDALKPVDADVAEEVKKPVKAAKPESIPPKSVNTPKPLNVDVVEEAKKPVKAAKPEVAQSKEALPKQVSASKTADVAEEVKKPVKAIKSESDQPMTAKDGEPKTGALGDTARPQEPLRQTMPKPVSSTPKPLDAAVEEAKKTAVAAVPKTEPSKPPVPEMVRWYIQVGSFSQKENALSLWDKLHQQGFPASLDTIPSEKGPTIYRLRIGPELDGKRAAAMKLKLDKQNIKAILISE